MIYWKKKLKGKRLSDRRGKALGTTKDSCVRNTLIRKRHSVGAQIVIGLAHQNLFNAPKGSSGLGSLSLRMWLARGELNHIKKTL